MEWNFHWVLLSRSYCGPGATIHKHLLLPPSGENTVFGLCYRKPCILRPHFCPSTPKQILPATTKYTTDSLPVGLRELSSCRTEAACNLPCHSATGDMLTENECSLLKHLPYMRPFPCKSSKSRQMQCHVGALAETPSPPWLNEWNLHNPMRLKSKTMKTTKIWTSWERCKHQTRQ